MAWKFKNIVVQGLLLIFYFSNDCQGIISICSLLVLFMLDLHELARLYHLLV